MEVWDDVDSEDGISFNRGGKDVFGVKIGFSVDWYIDRSVGAGIDKYFGDKLVFGTGGVCWYVGRGVDFYVVICIGDEVWSCVGVDRDIGDGFESGYREKNY